MKDTETHGLPFAPEDEEEDEETLSLLGNKSTPKKRRTSMFVQESTMCISFCFICLLFIVFGGIILSALEKPGEIERIKGSQTARAEILQQMTELKLTDTESLELFSFIQNRSKHAFKDDVLNTHWDVDDAMFFAFMLTSTLGQSSEFPTSWGGQLFCCLYVFIGIPLTIIFFTVVGSFLVSSLVQCMYLIKVLGDTDIDEAFAVYDADNNGYLDPTEFRAALLDMGVHEVEDPSIFHDVLCEIDSDGNERITINEFRQGIKHLSLKGPILRKHRVKLMMFLLVLFIVLGTIIFMLLEGWSPVTSAYFTIR